MKILDGKLLAKTLNDELSKKILSYHDRSDGGLITTVIEMAFAGRLGVDIQLDLLPSNSKEVLADLFNEELGVVIQVAKEDKAMVMEALDSCSLKEYSYPFAVLNKDKDIKLVEQSRTKYKCQRGTRGKKFIYY